MSKRGSAFIEKASHLLSTASLARIPANTCPYEEAIDLSGHGTFNRRAWLSCVCILTHAMLESSAISYIIPPAECDLLLTPSEKSWINASAFLGITVTAMFWGVMSDRFGRRLVMLPMVLITIGLSLASSMATTFLTMFLLRVSVGIFVSASVANVLVYCGEMHTSHKREVAIATCETCYGIAMILTVAVAWAVIPGKWSFYLIGVHVRPWRVFIWLWSVPGAVGAALLLLLPESPRFVLATKGPGKAIPIIAKMYALNYHKSAEDFPVKLMTSTTTILRSEKTTDTLKDLKLLFRAPLWRCTWISYLCMFGIYMLGNGLYMWMPDIANQVLFRLSSQYSICGLLMLVNTPNSTRRTLIEEVLPLRNVPQPNCKTGLNQWLYLIGMCMEAVFLSSYLVVTCLIKRYDKRSIYAVCMSAHATALVLSSLVPQLGLACFLLTIACSCEGYCTILTAAVVEVFPTSIRSIAICTLFMMGQVGATFGTQLVNLCLTGLCELVFIFSAIVIVGSCGCYYVLWPDPAAVRQEMEGRDFTY